MDEVDARLERLAWDTEHFGFAVARLRSDLDDGALAAVLARARAEGIRLVYFPAPAERAIAPAILQAFGGRLVDRKLTFARTLDGGDGGDAEPGAAGVTVAPLPRGEPGARVVELGVAAGWTSRFAVDPDFPRAKFRALYETWIRRSALGEIAGSVLVARVAEDPEPAGLLTLDVKDGVGSIGLIAVHAAHRGRHVASALIAAGHAWQREAGARRATVVTQLDNHGACALYRRHGYEVARRDDFFHFWL